MAPANPVRHPAWFGAVMGTGALTLAFASESEAWQADWLRNLAVVGLLLSTALALLLWPRYLVRLRDRAALATEIADPGHGAMLATMPAGTLVLATAWARVGGVLLPGNDALWVAGPLLVLGTLAALAFGFAWATAMVRQPVGLEGVHGGWLIPPVMNLLIPVALLPLTAAFPQYAQGFVLVGFLFLGVGTVLFLALLTLLIARLALRAPLPAPMAPALFIPLAPAGILGLATLRLLQAAAASKLPGFDSVSAGVVVTAMGLGFGLWWAVFALLEFRKLSRTGGAPVHPGWWGCVFPFGAMTLATIALASALQSDVLRAIGAVATVGLTLLWLAVAARTARLLIPRSTRSKP